MPTFWLILACPVLFMLGLLGGDWLARRRMRRMRRLQGKLGER